MAGGVCVCVNFKTGRHRTAALKRARPRGGAPTCACEREVCVWAAFVCCCFACDCVLELVVCQVRFARVFCPWLSLYDNVRCVWVAFVGGCFACGCVLERVVFRVRFARVSCPWLRFREFVWTQASSMAKLLQKLPSARTLVLQQKGTSKTRSDGPQSPASGRRDRRLEARHAISALQCG